MRILWLILLAGCAAAPQAPEPVPLRNPTVSVASQADVTADRLSGRWVVVQGANVAPGTPVTVTPEAIALGAQSLPFEDLGRGRFRSGDREVWVHWLDADNRTAAIGSPDGSRVWIMDRSGQPGERLRAAREILSWYGYDLSRMGG